ncbi:MAG: arylsulfatase [Verrucomicrobiota bacterium]
MRRIHIFLLLFALCPKLFASLKPNIIFIMADDLGYGDLGCYGQEFIQTPNINSLASEGIHFTQAYAGSSVCAPSRCVLMTGRHNGRGAARDNIPHYPTYLQEEDITIAEVLKGAGYRCGGIGKWSLGDPGTVGRPTNQGFDDWFGYLNQDHAHYYYTNYLNDGEGRYEMPGNMETKEHYSHHLMTERALEFIEESKAVPFFLYAAYTLPHFSSKSEDETLFAIPSDKPYSDRPWTQSEKNYAAMITGLDRDVGRIVELVEKLGLKEKTLIIFTSDNGHFGKAPKKFESSGGLRGAKSNLYEGGLRVPFIARWPGVIPAGQKNEEVIAFQDMLPTFAELAGARVPDEVDGISVVEALKAQPLGKVRDYLYWDYGHCRSRYDQAVRFGDWKGLRLGQDSDLELYDLRSDVAEERNVAKSHPDVVAKIEKIMRDAVTPSDRYPIGEIYKGKPLWSPAPLHSPAKSSP